MVNNPGHRKALTRFRIRAHNLEVETGRYNAVPLENRKCKHCGHNDIEDEIHFTFKCEKNNILRKELISYCNRESVTFNSLPMVHKLTFIMTSCKSPFSFPNSSPYFIAMLFTFYAQVFLVLIILIASL